MSKDVKVNEKNYTGVSIIQLPLADGNGNAQFKDVDEIIAPSGTKIITTNGTHDVKDYASVNVNVESGGSGGYSIDDLAGGAPSGEITITAPKVNEYAFAYKSGITKAIVIGASVVDSSGFSHCTGLTEVEFQTPVQGGSYAFHNCTALKKVTWKGKPNFIAGSCFNGCTALTDIYVPWAEGEVANAPWGADKATIHYNS
jgi:hypothetical protein